MVFGIGELLRTRCSRGMGEMLVSGARMGVKVWMTAPMS
jgi:hypothetical protein